MELVKLKHESTTDDTVSPAVETVTTADYKIMSGTDDKATQVGDATVTPNEVNIHIYGQSKTVSDMEAELTKMIVAYE